MKNSHFERYCDAVYCCSRIPTFQRKLLPASSLFHSEDVVEDLDLNLYHRENLKSRRNALT